MQLYVRQPVANRSRPVRQLKAFDKPMLRAGETERGIEQQGLTADYNEFARQRDYPMEQLKFQQSMLQGMPLSTVQSTPNPVSGLQNAVGTATGVASLYEALKKLGLG